MLTFVQANGAGLAAWMKSAATTASNVALSYGRVYALIEKHATGA